MQKFLYEQTKQQAAIEICCLYIFKKILDISGKLAINQVRH
jgi:hypothetical protein